MKAGSLWTGSDYAWVEYRGRGGPLPTYAKRVKVLDIRSVDRGLKKAETRVEVMFLEDDGTPKDGSSTREVRARDILNFWDDYAAEREPILEKQRENERKWEEERAAVMVGRFLRGVQINWEQRERIRIARERQEAQVKHLTRIHNVLITRGLKKECITVGQHSVTISIREIERWLGIETSK